MKQFNVVAAILLAGTLAWAAPVRAQLEGGVPAQTVVTVLPKKNETPKVEQQNLKLQVNGKQTAITGWQPLTGDRAGLELVLLIDNSARSSLGLQLRDLAKFIQSLPPETEIAVAYMQQGSAIFAQGFTTDHALAAKALRLPGGMPGTNASPYFCLSDLAKRWPSNNRQNRREVMMITDGVDRYNLRYDPEDPYLQAAITDSQRAGLIVYSIYYRDMGRISRTGYETNAGQSLLSEVSQATGGIAYWQGLSNPVSFVPFLDDFSRRLSNQYELSFLAPAKVKADLVDIRLKTTGTQAKVAAPERVLVAPASAPQPQ